jgi:hypothetical protein
VGELDRLDVTTARRLIELRVAPNSCDAMVGILGGFLATAVAARDAKEHHDRNRHASPTAQAICIGENPGKGGKPPGKFLSGAACTAPEVVLFLQFRARAGIHRCPL